MDAEMDNDQVAEPFRKLLNDFNREFLQDSHLEARDALRTIIAAADLTPDAQIPTPLMCAIEAARKVVA